MGYLKSPENNQVIAIDVSWFNGRLENDRELDGELKTLSLLIPVLHIYNMHSIGLRMPEMTDFFIKRTCQAD